MNGANIVRTETIVLKTGEEVYSCWHPKENNALPQCERLFIEIKLGV